jgi:transposase
LTPYKIDREGAIAPVFPPLQVAQVVALACSSPSEYGLSLQRWTLRDLQYQILSEGIVTQVHYTTVHVILSNVDLQPHRTLYWKHPVAEDFEEKAASVLWYYERVESLEEKGELLFCLDEKTQIQALSPPHPDIPVQPGCPLRRDHEYIRHGTANLFLIYDVYDGQLWGDTPSRTNSAHFTKTLEKHIRRFPQAKRIHYILDGAPSHSSKITREWLNQYKGCVQFHFTPAHASWLNMAELALSAFSRRYLKNGSWESRKELTHHIRNSLREYNRDFAYPFNWTFSRRKLHDWYQQKCCTTSPTRH